MLKREIGIYPILDDAFLLPADFVAAAHSAAKQGAGMIQIRVKKHGSGEFLKIASEVCCALKGSGVEVIVNDRVDIALLSGAGGVHLGEEDIPVEEARGLLRDGIIGFSTHNIADLERDFIKLCDYMAFGPVFETTTKESVYTPRGIGMLAEFVRRSEKPVVAIGGIGLAELEEVRDSGAAGAAMISALLTGDFEANMRNAIEIWNKKRT